MAGSPGATRMMINTRVNTATRVGIANPSRLSGYLSIFYPLVEGMVVLLSGNRPAVVSRRPFAWFADFKCFIGARAT